MSDPTRSPAEAAAPALDFLTLVLSIREGAFELLGVTPDGAAVVDPANLPAVRYQIDLLTLLKAKTAGNLTDEETKLIDAVIYELRLAYVEAAQGRGGRP